MRSVKCYVCEKDIILAPENIYKVVIDGKTKHLCGWGCLRNLERAKEAKKKPKEG